MSKESGKECIAILGGTGDLGTGLAMRWSKAGYKMIIGSRTLPKAQKAVADLQTISPQTPAEAMENGDAAAAGDIVVLTVPARHQLSTLAGVKDALRGKILIDVTVPLEPPRVGTVQLPSEGSAGKRARSGAGSSCPAGGPCSCSSGSTGGCTGDGARRGPVRGNRGSSPAAPT